MRQSWRWDRLAQAQHGGNRNMKFFRTLESAELDRSARTATPTRELGRREPAPRQPQPEQDRDIVEDSLGFLLRRVAGNSVETLDEVIVELKILRKTLQSEGARVEREVIEYATLTQAALQSTRIIAESLAHWRQAPEAAPRISA
jgi:hypothetical protein